MKLYRLIFAATVIAFNMTNYPILFGRFGFYGRYGCLLLLIPATVIFAARRQVRIPPVLLAAFYTFATYALATTFWTENFGLSLLKWMTYVAVALSLLINGIVTSRESDENPFWAMKWVFVPIVVVSAFALFTGFGWKNGNFQGFSGNSNALAATLALTSPWLLFEIRRSWGNQRARLYLLGLASAASLIVFFTFSRASIGALFIIVTTAGWSLRLGRKFLALYLLVGLIVGMYVFRPSTFHYLYEGFVLKRSEAVTKSRGNQMEDSWEAAKKGGVFGVGFGVSVGESRYWSMGSFSEVSREKGNSMLAIIEETGVAGFVLYLLLLYAIWGALKQLSRNPDQESRFVYRLGTGFFFGAIFHSGFEAWFLSSGPDVAVFWSTIGIFIGALTIRSRQANGRFAQVEAAARAGVFVPAPAPRR